MSYIIESFLQTHHVHFTLKRRGNGCFHIVSNVEYTWCVCTVQMKFIKDLRKSKFQENT